MSAEYMLSDAERVKLAAIIDPVTAIQTGGDKTLTQSDNTTYQDVPGLSVSLDVGTYLLGSSYLEVEGTTTADYKLKFVAGGGLTATGSWTSGGFLSTASNTVSSVNRSATQWGNATAILGLAGAATPVTINPTGLIVVTVAGTLKLQATQGTADASDVKVRNGVLRFTKIA